jgi:two-component system phosphate regulon sensor histidine kinase PhoR
MKKINLFVKYSVIYFISFLILIIIFANIIEVSNSTLLATAVSAIVLFAVSLYFIYMEIKKPIRKLYGFSSRLKLTGNENDPEFLREDIFDKKIEVLNEMLLELNNYLKKSVDTKEINDIGNELYSVSLRMMQELKTAKIFKVNRNEFLGNVAHELRTPIFAIQLSLETLLDGAIKDENVNMDFLKRAFNQTQRLKELVDDLISISKFETGIKMSKRYFNIGNMLGKTVDELKALAENKNIKFELKIADMNGVTVFGDEEKLQQVMVNLIDNAIKYTNKNGIIEVGMAVNEKDVKVYVQDTGIGIPKQDLPRIFERFYRVDKTRSRDVGGSGLGLSIVKHILEAHSSRIKVDSEENKGTRFEFILPR